MVFSWFQRGLAKARTPAVWVASLATCIGPVIAGPPPESEWSRMEWNSHGVRRDLSCHGIHLEYYVPPLDQEHPLETPDEFHLRVVNDTATEKWVIVRFSLLLNDTTDACSGPMVLNSLKPRASSRTYTCTTQGTAPIRWETDPDGFVSTTRVKRPVHRRFHALRMQSIAVLDLPLPEAKEPVNEGSETFYIASAGRYYSPDKDGVRCVFDPDELLTLRAGFAADDGVERIDPSRPYRTRPAVFPGPGGATQRTEGTGDAGPRPSVPSAGGNAALPGATAAPRVDLNELAGKLGRALDDGMGRAAKAEMGAGRREADAVEAARRFEASSGQVNRNLNAEQARIERVQSMFQQVQQQLGGGGGTGVAAATSSGVDRSAGTDAKSSPAGFRTQPPVFGQPKDMEESYQQAAKKFRWAAGEYRAQRNMVKARECEAQALEMEQRARSLHGTPSQALPRGR